mmetsp:Transcript_6876/g.12305  ORF Transcript_6876/g.12305 Transcript_6876/m.12305 type:complete len:273 (+) Transcript_6876:1464-2282(+)
MAFITAHKSRTIKCVNLFQRIRILRVYTKPVQIAPHKESKTTFNFFLKQNRIEAFTGFVHSHVVFHILSKISLLLSFLTSQIAALTLAIKMPFLNTSFTNSPSLLSPYLSTTSGNQLSLNILYTSSPPPSLNSSQSTTFFTTFLAKLTFNPPPDCFPRIFKKVLIPLCFKYSSTSTRFLFTLLIIFCCCGTAFIMLYCCCCGRNCVANRGCFRSVFGGIVLTCVSALHKSTKVRFFVFGSDDTICLLLSSEDSGAVDGFGGVSMLFEVRICL